MKIAVAFFRTLASQSAASLTASYLAAHLRCAGYDVSLIQLRTSGNPHDVDSIVSMSPDLVFYKPNFKDISRLRANLKALHATPLCLFGPFANLNADAILSEESTVRGILLANHEPVAHLGLRWLLGQVAETPLGYIARTTDGIDSSSADPSQLEHRIWQLWPARDIESHENSVIVNLEATRGCVRSCTFCHVPATTNMGGRRVYRRPPSDVVMEMDALWALGKRYFIFNDSVFGGGGSEGIRWIANFSEHIRRNGKPFLCYAYFTLSDLVHRSNTIELLANAGLMRIFVGIESSDDESIRAMRKGIRVSHYGAVKSKLKSLHVLPHIGFMLFHPFASAEKIVEGLKFLRRVDELHRFGVILERTRLIPGTQLHKEVTDAGLMEAHDFVTMRHAYRFAEGKTEDLYKRYQTSFEHIGIPILERLEHLFVSSEFLDNLTCRKGLETQSFQRRVFELEALRGKYSALFFELCIDLSEKVIPSGPEAEFRPLWERTEVAWEHLIREAERCGLNEPLSWVPSGDLGTCTSANYAATLTHLSTRSGTLVV